MITIGTLKVAFPRGGSHYRPNHAVTGVIPMDYFVANEKEIRAAAAAYFGGSSKYRTMYRGPRPQGRNAGATLRENATGVMIYAR